MFSQEVPDTTANKNPAADSIKVSINPKKADTLDASVRYLASDSMIMDMKDRKVYMYNNAEVYYKEINLNAGYIEMNFGEDQVYASGLKDSSGVENGKPEFTDGDEEFKSDSMRYNFKTKKGIISNVTTEQSGGFLHGQKVKRLADGNVCMKNGYYTTCDQEHPHYYINLTKAKVIPDDKIISGPAYLVVEDLPLPLGIPFGFFPNKKGSTSGIIIPEYGEEDNRGFFLRKGGYYFAINDYLSSTITGDIYSRGSWGLGPSTNYKKRYKFYGKLDFSYSKIIIGEPEMTTSYQNTNTYWFQWNHNQDSKAHPSRQFSANVNLGSTTYNKYNSYNTENRMRSNVQSTVSFSQRWQGTPFSLSGNLRHEQNFTDSTVTMGLPDMNFNVSRQYPFKSKKNPSSSNAFRKIGVSMTTNFKNSITSKEKDLFTSQGMQNFRNGIQHSIPVSTSMTLLKYFTLNPSLSLTSRWYLKSLDRKYMPTQYNATDTVAGYIETDTIDGFCHGTDWMITVPFTTKLYGFYMMKNPDALIKAVRHTLTPSVSFSYRPDFSQEKWGYYQNIQTDTAGNTALYSRFEGTQGTWTGIYGSPSKGKYGSVNFSLGNNLEMKARNRKDTLNNSRKINLLESFSISSSYNIAADSLKWAPVTIYARTSILQIITLNFSNSYYLYALDSLGRMIDTYIWDAGKGVARYYGATMSVGLNINSDSFKDKDAANNEKKEKGSSEAMAMAAQAAGFPLYYMDDYVDFSIPWNLMIDFRISDNPNVFNILKRDYDFKTTQTINFSGDMSLTSKWKIAVTSGYNVESKSITYTSFNIIRDLHCWEMRISWIPIGFYKSYNFQINVKASVLQDLKFNRRRNWTDNI